MSITLEVIALTPDDAEMAEAGGADRIELVADMKDGGSTPNPQVIRAVKRAVNIPVFVMIRPAGGGFVFRDSEVERMASEARQAREMGADGIVTGVLAVDGSIDVESVTHVLEAARLPATFHRAIDGSADIFSALGQVATLPYVERILTSGGRESAFDGRATIAELVRLSPIEVMPGAGVTQENVHAILRVTGARAIHVGTAARAYPGDAAPVSVARVRALKSILNSFGHGL